MTAPPTTKTSAMTIATIGRLMKNLDMAYPFAGCAGLDASAIGFTAIPSLTFCSPSVTTRSPGRSPSSTIHRPSTCSPAFTVRSATCVVGSDDGHLVDALRLLHRALRHEEAPRVSTWPRGPSHRDPGGGCVGVREERLHQDRPRLAVDLTVGDVEATGMGIRLPSARISSRSGSSWARPVS